MRALRIERGRRRGSIRGRGGERGICRKMERRRRGGGREREEVGAYNCNENMKKKSKRM